MNQLVISTLWVGIGAHLPALLHMPVNQRLDQFGAVQFVVVVGIVYLEVVELQFFLGKLVQIWLIEHGTWWGGDREMISVLDCRPLE